MAVLSHKPSGDWRNDGWGLAGSGVTALWQVLSSTDDTKYLTAPASKGGATVQFPVDITSIPDGAVITSATVKLRCSTGAGTAPAGMTPSLTVGVIPQDDTSKYTTRTIYPSATPTTYSVATYTRDALGQAWDIQRVNQLLTKVFSYGGVADLVRVHEMYVDFTYRTRPVLSVDGPSGTVYTSSPTINWTYTHQDGDAMGGLNYKLFTAAQVGDVAFDPNITPPVFADTLAGDLASVLLPTSINPNDYWVFTQAFSIFGAISQWVSRLFSILGPSPAPPGVPDPTGNAPTGIIEVVPNVEMGSATLNLQDTSNLLSVQAADAETTTDEHSCTTLNATMSRDTSICFPGGIGSWKVSSAAAGDMSMVSDWLEISSQGSGQITARAQFRATTIARPARVRILFYDTTFTALTGAAGTLTGTSITDSTSTWIEASVSGPIPAAAVYARAFYDVLGTAAAGEVHNIDKLSVSYGTNSPWSDGGHMSRNLLSSWYSNAEGAAGAGEAWSAGTASSTAVSSAIPGTGGSGSKCNTMTYAGLTPSIAYRGAGTTFTSPTTGTDYTLNKPSGVVSGDLMLAFVSASANIAAITPPAGWSLVDTSRVSAPGASDTTLWVLKRTAGGSEPASWSTGVIGASASRRTALVVAYSGAADAGMQFISEAQASTASATPLYLTTPSVSNTDPNAWRLSAFAVSDNATGGTLSANVQVPSAVPPISYVGKAPGWGGTNGANAFTINKPSGVVSGDLMIASLQIVGNLTVTAPSGWTTQWSGVASGGPSTHAVFSRIATASEPSSWTGSTTGSTGYTSITECVAYRNVNATTPFIAESGSPISNATAFPTPTVTNNNSSAWRVCSFGASTATSTGGFSEDDTIERLAQRMTYSGGFLTSPQSSAVAMTDSNGPVSTGNHTRTGTYSESAYSGAAWIGLLNPLASAPASVPNETTRVTAAAGSANPWTSTGVFDSGGVVATGSMSVTGSWAPGSGTDWNSAAGWVGLIKPAAPVVAGYVSASMATTVDISTVAENFDTRVTATATFIGSTSGTPYLTCYFYRANVLLATKLLQGNSFGTTLWVKSAATFDLPDGTTRMKLGVSVSDRAVGDVVYFDRVSLAYGSDTVYRSGTSRGARPVWTRPHLQYADDEGGGYGPWLDLAGTKTARLSFDPLSGVQRYTDHTVVPLVNRKYRARTVSHGLAGDRFVSPWGPESREFSFVASNWWLKDITNPSCNVQLNVGWNNISVATNNHTAVFQPLGTDLPVVLSEGFKGDTFSLTLVPVRHDSWAQLRRLLKSGKTLFLQSDTDLAWWVRPVTDLVADLLPTGTRKSDPVRSIKVSFVQVDPIP